MKMFRIYDNVSLGNDPVIEEYALVGVLPEGGEPAEMKTIIGNHALIRSHSVIYAGNVIGDRFRTGHGVLIRECNQIGHDVSIGSHSVIEHHVFIGHGVRIHSNVFIPEFSLLEDGAWIGPNAVFTNAVYPKGPHTKRELKGPRISENARIGANATLLPGVVVGRNALVGAGSVVTCDVPEGKVVAGNPARIINDIEALVAYRVK